MNILSSSVNSVEWRRSKVQELSSQGYNQSEISRILQISQPTINRDITYLRQQAKSNIKKYIDERLPEEYEKCLVGINMIKKEAWTLAQNTKDNKEKIQALSLIKECHSMKLELLTNATIVDDAIRFVSQQAKERIKSSSEGNQEESREPDYDEDKDQLEEEQEEESRELTLNQVF
jgi:predicted transcriptional regulator